MSDISLKDKENSRKGGENTMSNNDDDDDDRDDQNQSDSEHPDETYLWDQRQEEIEAGG